MSRVSSETLASSEIGNGGVFASFSTRTSVARTSISPVGTFGFVVFGRAPFDAADDGDHELRAQPLDALDQRLVAFDYHLRVAVAVAHVDEEQRSEIANVCTQPRSTTSLPTSAGEGAQVWVRARVPSCSAIVVQIFDVDDTRAYGGAR